MKEFISLRTVKQKLAEVDKCFGRLNRGVNLSYMLYMRAYGGLPLTAVIDYLIWSIYIHVCKYVEPRVQYSFFCDTPRQLRPTRNHVHDVSCVQYVRSCE